MVDPSEPSVSTGGFTAVDRHPDGGVLVAALDEQAQLPAFQRLRASGLELLRPAPGQHLIDVGCGTGDLTRALADRVAPAGMVVGIDPSETMLAEARRRHGDSSAMEFRAGDATRLDADDAAFDGAWSERVLQHLHQPEVAMAELVRVTKRGGRIVVVDTDWGMHAIEGADPDLTAAVVAGWAEHAPNGRSGRRLHGLFVDAGLDDVAIAAETFTSTDPQRPTREPFTIMAATAERTGALSAADAQTWLDQLAAAGKTGHFFWAVTMFAVAGTRL